MTLASAPFLVFLCALLLVYWPLMHRRTAPAAVILIATAILLARWHPAYIVILPAAASCDFLIGRTLGRTRRPAARRLLLAASVTLNLGLMLSVKYLPFFAGAWASLRGAPPPEWRWVLPLGLSFYAFQSLTYTIDVYRGDMAPSRSLLAYITSATFFPTLLAGPITRLAGLLPQFSAEGRALKPDDGGRALFRIGLGLAKKFLIADYLAENLVNRVFDSPNLYSGFEVLIAVYAYAIQIYYDFSGYTDIAIGSATLLGIRLPENFNRPYLARNLPDFWRRWHITLSTWLRDYLFFSLPGLRSKWKFPAYLNLIVTMVLGGLWHGPSWTFVIWGALHGAGLAAYRLDETMRGKAPPRFPLLSAIVTFHFVCFTWLFFRAASVSAAIQTLERIASLTVSTANLTAPILVVLAAAAALHVAPKALAARLQGWFVAAPSYAQALVLAALLTSLRFMPVTGSAPFIYTRF